MAIPVIDFSRLDGDDRAAALAEIAAGFEEWGFFQVGILIAVRQMFSKGCQCSVILMRGFCEAACEHWYP
jgi:aminocyclopropanecarboxylate oxidase